MTVPFDFDHIFLSHSLTPFRPFGLHLLHEFLKREADFTVRDPAGFLNAAGHFRADIVEYLEMQHVFFFGRIELALVAVGDPATVRLSRSPRSRRTALHPGRAATLRPHQASVP